MKEFKTFRFRDFVIYQRAKKFRLKVLQSLCKFPSDQRFSLVQQIDRASYSIILNIAEGSAKRSDIDFRRFLEMSIASLNEVVAGFDCAVDSGFLSDAEMQSVENDAEYLAKQIGSFMKKLTANC